MAEQGAGVGRTATQLVVARSRVDVRLNEGVSLENLQGIVARIVNLTGCTGCGLLGVDLVIGGDPAEARQIGAMPGVKSVSLG